MPTTAVNLGTYIEEPDSNTSKTEVFEGIDDGTEIAANVCELSNDPLFCQVVKGLTINNFKTGNEIPKKTLSELRLLSTRQYLDQVLVPILMRAIAYIAKTRPPNAIKAFALYLLKYRAEYEIVEDENAGSNTVDMLPSPRQISECFQAMENEKFNLV